MRKLPLLLEASASNNCCQKLYSYIHISCWMRQLPLLLAASSLLDAPDSRKAVFLNITFPSSFNRGSSRKQQPFGKSPD
jgi:hypothetical protein